MYRHFQLLSLCLVGAADKQQTLSLEPPSAPTACDSMIIPRDPVISESGGLVAPTPKASYPYQYLQFLNNTFNLMNDMHYSLVFQMWEKNTQQI